MNKITKFFSNAGVALGTLVGSIAIAVNVGLARAPEMGGTSFVGNLLGTILVTAGVIAAGTTATVIKLVKDSNEKQKLLGTDKTENESAKNQTNKGTEKANKNIYSSKVNYSNRGNNQQNNSGAAKFGESFGRNAAQFGESIGRGAEKLGEEIGRGAEKIGEGLNKFFSDSRNNGQKNNNQGHYTNSYNARPNNGYYQNNNQNGYYQNNAGYNNGQAYNQANRQNNAQYNNANAYNPNNTQYGQYNQGGAQGFNPYVQGNGQNMNQGNNQGYNQNGNGYNAGANRQNQNIDKAATSNYFDNAPGDSQYRSGNLKQNATSDR